MTRDHDSGKGRRPHVDHAFREVTRPGVHVPALDDTPDDFADEPTPIREHHRLAARVDGLALRVTSVEDVARENKIAREAMTELPTTEAWRALSLRVEAAEAGAADGRAIGAAVRRAKGAAWAALGTAITGLGAALWFAIGVARSSGIDEGVAREREVQRVESVNRLRLVEEVQQDLRNELSRILGMLDASRPYRAQPYIGPRDKDD